MRPLLLAPLLALALGACTEPYVTEAPACPPEKKYSAEFNKRLAARLGTEPADSPFVTVTRDYMVLRRQCRSKPKDP